MGTDSSSPRPSVAQLSKTPSWVMLGFVLGALFIWALPKPAPAPRPIVIAAPPPERRATEPRELTTIEAVFDQWSEYAVWDHDVTQVALWNSAVGDFAESYEVRKLDGIYYFRSLPHLTNRIVRHGKPPPPECPLRFTETEVQYREWHDQGRIERPAENLRSTLAVPREVPATPKPSVEPPPPIRNPQLPLSPNPK